MEGLHQPVMVRQVIEALRPHPGGVYVDCTLGDGGHAKAIAERCMPGGRVIGIDRDREALERAKERLSGFGGSVDIVHGVFSDLESIAQRCLGSSSGVVDGILFDLGVSSLQVERAERGMSYWSSGPLDMRMDTSSGVTAKDLVNSLSQEELRRIIQTYGEERWAPRIARFIVSARKRKPIETTDELAAVIKEAIPARFRRSGPHPARRTFQALRIAVNWELDHLKKGLLASIRVSKPKARICVISYHSLEDRIVKETFRDSATADSGLLEIITPKPLVPPEEEVAINPRSRSAKMRVAERTAKPWPSE
ncbi:MAG TPA: 16S rRNA (cytosine(1402)-N(4))-methyltransferase RsmH [Clostridia bacterium]|nr:16S rRNA (cytosine(1402)-N(4))-methyltransferase RsmH [Clostridia bacterium]